MAAIKDIIAQVIGDMSGTSAVSRKDLAAAWRGICPDGAAVVDLKEGAAVIHVDSALRLAHLNARRASLLKEVQSKCPQVRQLKFKVGKVTST